MSYTQDHKKEILEAAKFLKEQNFREETNFSLYATAEQMVRWHEKQANEAQKSDSNCNIQRVSNRFSPLKNDTSDANMICILTERYNEIADFLNGC